MKNGTDDHPKTHDLASNLKINIGWACGILELLWMFTGEYCPAGDIGKYSDTAIARACHWPKDPHVFVVALVECGWLDKNCIHRLVVHDWHVHCSDYVKKKVNRQHLKFASQHIENTENVSGQCPENVEKSLASRARGTQPNPTQPNPTAPIPTTEASASSEVLSVPESVCVWNSQSNAPLPKPVQAVARTHTQSLSRATGTLVAVNGGAKYPSAIATRSTRAPDAACESWAVEMYQRHPKKKHRVLAEQAMVEVWASMRDPPAEAAEISRVHKLWCATDSWTEKAGQFCPQLGEWLHDRGYLSEPPEDAVDRVLRERVKRG